MRSRFQQGLDELKEKLLRMGGLAEQAIDRATEAYRTRDSKFCQMVLSGEAAINEAEREIDELSLDLLAMQQPMAIDLRFLFSVIKINADLERVGDQAVNIAERVIDLVKFPVAELPVDIARMASIAAASASSDSTSTVCTHPAASTAPAGNSQLRDACQRTMTFRWPSSAGRLR